MAVSTFRDAVVYMYSCGFMHYACPVRQALYVLHRLDSFGVRASTQEEEKLLEKLLGESRDVLLARVDETRQNLTRQPSQTTIVRAA